MRGSMFNITNECNVYLWDPDVVPHKEIYEKLKAHGVLSGFHRLDEITKLSPLGFPGWIADLQQYAEKNQITVYAQ